MTPFSRVALEALANDTQYAARRAHGGRTRDGSSSAIDNQLGNFTGIVNRVDDRSEGRITHKERLAARARKTASGEPPASALENCTQTASFHFTLPMALSWSQIV